ncbi:hypothetical protein GCK72_004662 [Caenorhabditis remanei]|uniref:Nematode Specific Peptide family, group B n=1 Tax=Caenorhabditis remanei TaxID=31234 RepID=A0A6A5HEJ7_CAERE|nr:hypothetical protein GCK72_004662 [Caenorhabditis remanei]KAF1764712.1 hypothetical protein GCK72_004662 [Caenorhabditis remanei]
MFSKCITSILLISFLMFGLSTQQVVVPAYSAAPYAYAYPSVYSPYLTAAAYPSVWAWGSNKNKGGDAAPVPSPSTLLNNNQKSA